MPNETQLALQTEIDQLKAQNEQLQSRLEALENKHHSLVHALGEMFQSNMAMIWRMTGDTGRQAPSATIVKDSSNDALQGFYKLSTKAHAVAQMVCRGARNDEIAERIGVSLSTVKVMVHHLRKKLDAPTRSALAVALKECYDAVSDDQYPAISGGLPLDWDKNYHDKYESDYKELFAKTR